jgi:hypothetical protein
VELLLLGQQFQQQQLVVVVMSFRELMEHSSWFLVVEQRQRIYMSRGVEHLLPMEGLLDRTQVVVPQQHWLLVQHW